MKVDPIWVMLGIELLVILLCVSVFLGFRQKRLRAGLREPLKTDSGPLMELVAKEILRLKKQAGLPDDKPKTLANTFEKELVKANINYLERIAGVLQKGEGDFGTLSEHFDRSFKGMLEPEPQLQHLKGEGQQKYQPVQEEASHDVPLSEKFNDFFKLQRKRLSNFSVSETVIEHFQEKFAAMKKRNRELREQLNEVKDEAERCRLMEMVAEELELTNQELDLCVQTLENENRDLLKKIAEVERDAEGEVADFLKVIDQQLTEKLSSYEKELMANKEAGGFVDEGEREELLAELEGKNREILEYKERIARLEEKYSALCPNTNSSEEAVL